MITDQLARIVREAIDRAYAAGELPFTSETATVSIDPPKNREHGDFMSNVALVSSKEAGMPAREVAERIKKNLDSPILEGVDVAGPGFLNFKLSPQWLYDALTEVHTQDTVFGNNSTRSGEKTLIEFVSANPTGPISVVNGRAAALGDSLARLLAACGAEVGREFYVNDALNSTQLNLMGESLAARYLQLLGQGAEIPQEGYHGEYLVEIARELVAEAGDTYAALGEGERAAKFRQLAAERMIAQQQHDLEAFGVVFDKWFFESSLYQHGTVQAAINEMKRAGHAYMKDEALWLKTTELSKDDQDRVLVRSNGKETYIAADAAYHKDKFDRGWNRLINIWGADHHGYVERLKASVVALGHDSSQCEIILTQMVLLVRNGEPVRGSKRAGDIIPLIDLVEEVGRDAARFYCLMTHYETTATFDLEMAKKQSSDNPVFYAQYAHARCCNVLAKAEEREVNLKTISEIDLTLLKHPRELELLRKLADFPGEVKMAADMLAPHRLAAYVREIGQALHQFYEECPALKDGVPEDLRDARLAIFVGTRIVVRNLLALLGVSAPSKM